MSWWKRLFRRPPAREAHTTLKLRVTRFRHLLEAHGALQELLEDAAEKQGGGFILDRQYVVTLVEQVAEIADAAVFDLNVVTSQGSLAFYAAAERLRADLRGLLAEEAEGSREEAPEPDPVPATGASPISPPALAQALARASVLFRESGQIACRGATAGPVHNLAEGLSLGGAPPGSVLVAEDLPREGTVDLAVTRPSAILLDGGTAASPAARLAREWRIPAIVGLSTVTARLPSGTLVTVDADENVVYLGRIPELLEYHRSTRLGEEEEREYTLLRSVRRAAFPLTLAASQPAPSLEDCLTLHDVVHLSLGLAGDALGDLLAMACDGTHASVALDGTAWRTLRLIWLEEPHEDGSGLLPSRPLRAFLDGIVEASAGARAEADTMTSRSLCAVATEERALVAATTTGGLDLLDFATGGSSTLNTVYCRFMPRGGYDPDAVRGAFAAAALSRLGFTVSATGRDVCGFSRGLPSAETARRVRLLGRLLNRLARLEAGGLSRAAVDPAVDAFLSEAA